MVMEHRGGFADLDLTKLEVLADISLWQPDRHQGVPCQVFVHTSVAVRIELLRVQHWAACITAMFGICY
jgi:hypothetical protein